MAERGRKAGFRMGADHRTKIANSKVLKRLIDHAEGNEPDMTSTEVQAAISLLDRVMPKLQSMSISGDEDNPLSVIHKIEREIVRPKNQDA